MPMCLRLGRPKLIFVNCIEDGKAVRTGKWKNKVGLGEPAAFACRDSDLLDQIQLSHNQSPGR